MSEQPRPGIGRITWMDLTVPNATEVRDFYEAVVGWRATPHPMGDYDDYDIRAPGGDEVVAGICHARGPNADLPAQWLVYINVEDLDASIAACRERGGDVIKGPADLGPYGRLAVVRDPAGAAAALIEPPR